MYDNVHLLITVADDKCKIPQVERDFGYESEQIDIRFMILGHDVDRFLNGMYPCMKEKNSF